MKRPMDIINALRTAGRPLDDEELAAALGLDPAAVTRECKRMAFAGRLIREQGHGGAIVNRLDAEVYPGQPRTWSGDLTGSRPNQ